MARNEKEKQDKNGEKIIHQFLLENFYFNDNICENKELLESSEFEQIKGIDTLFFHNGKKYKCDEKAALDYINKDYKLSTFCLELSFLNRKDELMEGWFTNDKNDTNSYLFVWVDKAKNDIITSVDDILEAEISLVWKQDIYDYFNSLGWTKDKLREKARRIRSGEDTNFGNYNENGCKFSFAQYLPEKPINILLKREIYNNMSNTINIKWKRS